MARQHATGDNRRHFLWCLAGLAASGMVRRVTAIQDTADPLDALPAAVWKNARENGLVMIHRPTPSRLSPTTQIVRPDEPGEALVVAGQVVAPDGRSPAAGITVYAYNTDAEGYYGEDHKEYPPRLYGWMLTDAAGRFELRSIRPGRYPGMRVPAHVHFELWGGGYPAQWAEELKFDGDSYLTHDAMATDAQRGEFRTVQPLAQAPDRTWRCSFRIRLQRATNFR
jgi:protocatechuate 3,4-dioxygenase, beta subunit